MDIPIAGYKCPNTVMFFNMKRFAKANSLHAYDINLILYSSCYLVSVSGK